MACTVHAGCMLLFASALNTLVCSAGAKYMRISNCYHEPASGAAAVMVATQIHQLLQQQQQQQLPQQQDKQQLPALPCEQQLLDWIGPPHNYRGFPADTTGPVTDANASVAASTDASGTAAATGGSSTVVPGLPLAGLNSSSTSAVPGELAELLAAAEVRITRQFCQLVR